MADQQADPTGLGIRGLINQEYEAASAATPRGIYRDLTQGLNGPSMLKGDGQFENQIAYAPGQDKALSSAIQSKYQIPYNLAHKRLENSTKLEAKNQKFEKLHKAAILVAEEQEMNYQKAMLKYKAQLAKKAARGALLGNLLGIGGLAAGAYAGGPGGAVAGQQAGQSIGNSLGTGGT